MVAIILVTVLVTGLSYVLGYVLGSVAFGYFKGGESRALRRKHYLAMKTLRLIASDGAGNPQMEAIATLDEIENLEIKEPS